MSAFCVIGPSRWYGGTDNAFAARVPATVATVAGQSPQYHAANTVAAEMLTKCIEPPRIGWNTARSARAQAIARRRLCSA